MNIVFRTDASLDIGTGHVMRCLTLADALRERGARCHFVCRGHSGQLSALIEQRGHVVRLLPRQSVTEPMVSPADNTKEPPHAIWLGAGTTQRTDAQDTLAAIRFCTGRDQAPFVDWLIVDHYALDSRWESLLRPICRHLMVIDDLADRPHDCDLLLDQSLDRKEADYAALVPGHATRLIGPSYTLLRPEFAQRRPYSLSRRRVHSGLQHLLVAMGGVDKNNFTGQVLEAIAGSSLPSDIHITVVLGSSAPWLEQVHRQAANMPHTTQVLSNVSNMAQVMADADLAIGAAGGTAWERCCLGLPSILLVLAENQKEGARALAARHAAMIVSNVKEIPHILHRWAKSPIHGDGMISLSALSRAAASVTDGTGTMNVANIMTARTSRPPTMTIPIVRKMQEGDLPLVLTWRNHPVVREHMLTQHEISLEEHSSWFARASLDASCCLLIVEQAGQPLGYVQFSNVRKGTAAEWGFYAVPDAPKGSGRKLGSAALAHAFRVLNVHKVCGQALSSNQTSIAFHKALGFQQEGVWREQHYIAGQWHDMVCFGLLASEWLSMQSFES